jgi:hypothetical protein
MASVFAVSENDINDQSIHGLFSTREKADAYVALVAEAETVAGIAKADRTVLDVEEMELDELTRVRAFFTAAQTKGNSVVSKRIQYRETLPQARFFVDGSPIPVPFGAEASGTTPAEARAALKREMGKI